MGLGLEKLFDISNLNDIIIRNTKQKNFQLTWFLSGFFMTQLSQIITSTCVHCSVIQNKYSVSESTSNISDLFIYKKVTFSGLQYNFFINSTQTQLSKRCISPAQHVCNSFGLPVSIKNSLLKHWKVGGISRSEERKKKLIGLQRKHDVSLLFQVLGYNNQYTVNIKSILCYISIIQFQKPISCILKNISYIETSRKNTSLSMFLCKKGIQFLLFVL